MAVDYFHNQSPSVEGLKDGENEAEWIVDLTTQVGWAFPGSRAAAARQELPSSGRLAVSLGPRPPACVAASWGG
jgi:hypothetical protein